MSDVAAPAPAPAPARRPLGRRLLCAYAEPGDGARWLLVGLGLLLDLLWLPPGVLGVHVPLLVLVGDVPFLLLVWHAGGARWKRWVLLYGAAHFAVSLHWLAEVGAMQLVGAALGLAPVTLMLAWALRLGASSRLPFVPLVGLGVVLEEWMRTVWLGGMPWPQRSLGLVHIAELRAAAALAGAYGLSFLAGMTSAVAVGVVGVVRAPYAARPYLAPRLLGAALLPALWALVLLLHGGVRMSHLDRAIASGRAGITPRMLVVQANVPQVLKHAPDREAGNRILNRHTELTRAGLAEALRRRNEVLAVLWPETMVPWPFLSPALFARFPEDWRNLVTVAGRLRATLPEGLSPPHFLIGGIHRFEQQPAGADGEEAVLGDHDSLFWIDVTAVPPLGAPPPAPPPATDGLLPWERLRHDKVVRVPGGEFTPLADVLPPLKAFRDALSQIPEIARGADEQEPFLLHTWAEFPDPQRVIRHEVRAGTVICFEIAFPARCRAWRLAHGGCQVLLNPANYGWFGPTAFRAQIRGVAALRAAELGLSVVMAGNTGPTAFFDPVGRIYGSLEPRELDEAGFLVQGSRHAAPIPAGSDEATFRTGFVLETLIADDAETLYARWGDLYWWFLTGLLSLAGVLKRCRRPTGAEPPSTNR